MQPDFAEKRDDHAALRRRCGVKRLDVFGPAARGADFNSHKSDFDFLVDFEQYSDLSRREQFLGLAEALEKPLGRPVGVCCGRSIQKSGTNIEHFLRLRAQRE